MLAKPSTRATPGPDAIAAGRREVDDLRSALQISESKDGYVLLLWPGRVRADGECEAGLHDPAFAPLQRWPSLPDLLEAHLAEFRESDRSAFDEETDA